MARMIREDAVPEPAAAGEYASRADRVDPDDQVDREEDAAGAWVEGVAGEVDKLEEEVDADVDANATNRACKSTAKGPMYIKLGLVARR